MTSRRTPAPDIAACVLGLFAATLSFSVLQALYRGAVLHGALYLGLLGACALAARGLLLRRPAALPVAIVLLLLALGCALFGFHVPETAELPAGLLGLLGAALLLGSRGEFAPAR